jgi:penicillin-binding protein 2
VRGISQTQWTGLNEDPYRPLANKATQGLYPPGSTYKMIVALAALEAGVIDTEEQINCVGHTELGNRRFHCWQRQGHGRVGLIEAISQSCDVFFYDLAQRVGIEAISAMAVRLGCGVRHDLPLSGIAQGLAPTMQWKRRNRGEDWVVGDTLNASIGQGFVLTSPLQLAVMTARLATGRLVEPNVVRSVDGVPRNGGTAPELGISRRSPRHHPPGDVAGEQRPSRHGLGSRVMEEAYLVAGKTGTSQVRNITAAEREAGVISNEDLPWERRDHALYVGYAPFEAPRYAVSVVVEHGGGGAAVAAPIARDILLRAQVGDDPAARALPGVPAPRHRGDAPPPADPRGAAAPSGRASARPGTGTDRT